MNKSKTGQFPSREEMHLCDRCGILVKNLTNFKRHNTSIHGKYKTEFICTICEKHFLHKSSLKRHSINAHGIPETRFSTVTKKQKEFTPEIKPPQPWTPPFEGRVKFRIKTTPTLPILFKPGFRQLTIAAALKIIGSNRNPKPSKEELLEDLELSSPEPTPSSSTSTVCMDENLVNSDIPIGVYGRLQDISRNKTCD